MAVNELTARELELLQLIAAGYTNNHIGKLLGISHSTAATHRANIRRKLGATNTAEMIRLAYDSGRLR